MILDERSYLIKPEHVRDYLDTYVAEGMALQISHLGDLVGWFTTDVGNVNEVVHIWRYQRHGRPRAAPCRHGSRSGLAGISQEDVVLRDQDAQPHPAADIVLADAMTRRAREQRAIMTAMDTSALPDREPRRPPRPRRRVGSSVARAGGDRRRHIGRAAGAGSDLGYAALCVRQRADLVGRTRDLAERAAGRGRRAAGPRAARSRCGSTSSCSSFPRHAQAIAALRRRRHRDRCRTDPRRSAAPTWSRRSAATSTVLGLPEWLRYAAIAIGGALTVTMLLGRTVVKGGVSRAALILAIGIGLYLAAHHIQAHAARVRQASQPAPSRRPGLILGAPLPHTLLVGVSLAAPFGALLPEPALVQNAVERRQQIPAAGHSVLPAGRRATDRRRACRPACALRRDAGRASARRSRADHAGLERDVLGRLRLVGRQRGVRRQGHGAGAGVERLSRCRARQRSSAATAMLDNIIPPSIAFLILATATNLSVGSLLVGGFVAGGVLAAGAGDRASISPRATKGRLARLRRAPSERALSMSSLPAIGLGVVVVVGIRFGMVTTTEASALAVAYALIVCLALRSVNGRIGLRGIPAGRRRGRRHRPADRNRGAVRVPARRRPRLRSRDTRPSRQLRRWTVGRHAAGERGASHRGPGARYRRRDPAARAAACCRPRRWPASIRSSSASSWSST